MCRKRISVSMAPSWFTEARKRGDSGAGTGAVPVLTIFATHREAAQNRVLAEALRRAGARVTAREMISDHPFADHRIAMEVEVVRWLGRIEAHR